MIPAFALTFVEGLLGPYAKFAKPLIYLVAFLVAFAAVAIVIKVHDHRVIVAHDDKQIAATATADKKADDNAGDQRVTDVTRVADEKTQTQEAINEAHRSGADPRAAYYQCVLKQQSARHSGKPSPKC